MHHTITTITPKSFYLNPNMASSSSSFHASTFTPQIIILIFFCISCCALGFDAQNVIDSPLLTQKLGINRTIKVDINGNGDFKSVQAAIDSIPDGNPGWVIVHVRKGVYRYKVINNMFRSIIKYRKFSIIDSDFKNKL